MDMLYELWDTVTANLTGEYPTEEDALAALYRTVEKAGPDALAGYALMRDDGVHDPVLIAADHCASGPRLAPARAGPDALSM